MRKPCSKKNFFYPDVKELETCVNNYEMENKYPEEQIYKFCVQEFSKNFKNIQEAKEELIKLIKFFLINWGSMGVLLNRKDKGGWERKVLDVLTKEHELFKKFTGVKIDECEIGKMKYEIEKCYGKLKEVLGPTGASKILHLINPEFFPMWDSKIREKSKIKNDSEAYHNFLSKIKKCFFLNRQINETLEKLSEKYGKSKLKIIDEYMWWKVWKTKNLVRHAAKRNSNCKIEENGKKFYHNSSFRISFISLIFLGLRETCIP